MKAMQNMGNIALSVTWSIAIEEQFYILFPFIVYFIKDQWLPYALIILIVLASFFRLQFNDWIPRYVLLASRMDALSLGVLVAYFNLRMNLAVFIQKYISVVLGLLLLDVIFCGLGYFLFGDLGVIKHFLFAFFFAGVLAIVLTQRQYYLVGLLRNSVLMWIGTISYSLYLSHYLILGLAHHFLDSSTQVGSSEINLVLVTSVALATSLGLSWLIFRYLEAPMVRFGKRFEY